MNGTVDTLSFPAGAVPWIAQRTGGQVLGIERMSVRREAWRALVDDGSGTPKSYFLRIDRELAAGRPYPRDLERETALIEYLSTRTGIPTQRILGWNAEHAVAIQSFEPGRADLHNAPHDEQHDVMMHFMDIMAEMHRIDIGRLDAAVFCASHAAKDAWSSLRALVDFLLLTDGVDPGDLSTLEE